MQKLKLGELCDFGAQVTETKAWVLAPDPSVALCPLPRLCTARTRHSCPPPWSACTGGSCPPSLAPCFPKHKLRKDSVYREDGLRGSLKSTAPLTS